MKRKIVIIGSGKLATALVSGFIHAGIEKESIMVIGRDALKLSRFNTMGIKTSSAMNDVADAVNVLMAVTPAGAGQILQSLRKAKDECINRAFYVERIISFVSGLTITQINKSLRFPHAKILRATCNTNIAFGQGIICLSGVVNKNTDQCHVKHATQLLSVLGEVVREYPKELTKSIATVGSMNAFDALAIKIIFQTVENMSLVSWLEYIEECRITGLLQNSIVRSESQVALNEYLRNKVKVLCELGYGERALERAHATFKSTLATLRKIDPPSTSCIDALIKTVVTKGGCTEKGIGKITGVEALHSSEILKDVFFSVYRRALKFKSDVKRSFDL